MVSTVQAGGMCFTGRLRLVASLGGSNRAFLGEDGTVVRYLRRPRRSRAHIAT